MDESTEAHDAQSSRRYKEDLDGCIDGLKRAEAQIEALQREIADRQRVLSEMASMKNCFRPGHPEQAAYDKVCSIWLTESTPEREQHAYRDGHFAGWQSAVSWMQNKEMLRVARRVITEHSDTLKNLKER